MNAMFINGPYMNAVFISGPYMNAMFISGSYMNAMFINGPYMNAMFISGPYMNAMFNPQFSPSVFLRISGVILCLIHSPERRQNPSFLWSLPCGLSF